MTCRVCGGSRLVLVVDLGFQPWCNHFLTIGELGREPKYPLRLVHCQSCRTAQLDYTVPKEVMFADHTYLSGITASLSEHFRQVAVDVDRQFFKESKEKSVLDVGSNDGTQLQHYRALGYDILGIEASKTTAKIANKAGIPTLNEFFNLRTSRSLGRKFDVINAAGVFFHLEELHSVTDGIRELLKDDGVFVVQFLYMKSIMQNGAFDQIYHEHLLYYNLCTIDELLARHSLMMFDAYVSPIHGGSVIGFVAKPGGREQTDRLRRLRHEEECEGCNDLEAYQSFSRLIEKMKRENLEYLSTAKAFGKRIFGFGAPAKGNTLLNHFGIGRDYLDCLVEKNTLRRGLFSPGMHIPIVMEDQLQDAPDVFYVLAWNFKNEILARNQYLLDRGVEFYFPVEPKEIVA
jgi:SAM-dependent methyltransferase